MRRHLYIHLRWFVFQSSYIVGCRGALQLGGPCQGEPTKGIRLISSRVTKLSQRNNKNSCLTSVKHFFNLFILVGPTVTRPVQRPPSCQLLNNGLYIQVIYENDIQIRLKIDSFLPGFEPMPSPVASPHANHWAMTTLLNKISLLNEFIKISIFTLALNAWMPSKQSFATKKVDPHQKHRFFLKF